MAISRFRYCMSTFCTSRPYFPVFLKNSIPFPSAVIRQGRCHNTSLEGRVKVVTSPCIIDSPNITFDGQNECNYLEDSDKEYALSFLHSRFTHNGLISLEEKLANYTIVYLDLSHCQFPREFQLTLMEIIRKSDLKTFKMIGVPLGQKAIDYLVESGDDLRVETLHITVEAGVDVSALERYALQNEKYFYISRHISRKTNDIVTPVEGGNDAKIPERINLFSKACIASLALQAHDGFCYSITNLARMQYALNVLTKGFHFFILDSECGVAMKRSDISKSEINSCAGILFIVSRGRSYYISFASLRSDVGKEHILPLMGNLFSSEEVPKTCNTMRDILALITLFKIEVKGICAVNDEIIKTIGKKKLTKGLLRNKKHASFFKISVPYSKKKVEVSDHSYFDLFSLLKLIRRVPTFYSYHRDVEIPFLIMGLEKALQGISLSTEGVKLHIASLEERLTDQEYILDQCFQGNFSPMELDQLIILYENYDLAKRVCRAFSSFMLRKKKIERDVGFRAVRKNVAKFFWDIFYKYHARFFLKNSLLKKQSFSSPLENIEITRKNSWKNRINTVFIIISFFYRTLTLKRRIRNLHSSYETTSQELTDFFSKYRQTKLRKLRYNFIVRIVKNLCAENLEILILKNLLTYRRLRDEKRAFELIFKLRKEGEDVIRVNALSFQFVGPPINKESFPYPLDLSRKPHRSLIVPEAQSKLGNISLVGIELAILAMISGDVKLQKVLKKEKDPLGRIIRQVFRNKSSTRQLFLLTRYILEKIDQQSLVFKLESEERKVVQAIKTFKKNFPNAASCLDDWSTGSKSKITRIACPLGFPTLLGTQKRKKVIRTHLIGRVANRAVKIFANALNLELKKARCATNINFYNSREIILSVSLNEQNQVQQIITKIAQQVIGSNNPLPFQFMVEENLPSVWGMRSDGVACPKGLSQPFAACEERFVSLSPEKFMKVGEGYGQLLQKKEIDTLLHQRMMETLQNQFGFTSLRPFQQTITAELLQGNSIFCISPPGTGKSICYQLFGVMKEGSTIVVSPLRSLIFDQIAFLSSKGIKAVYLPKSLDKYSLHRATSHIENTKFIFVSPEMGVSPEFLLIIRKININGIIVDEAHCVLEWGTSFRPEYLELKKLTSLFPRSPVLSLSATVTPRDVVQVKRLLGAVDSYTLINIADRPNLQLSIEAKRDLKDQLLRFLEANPNTKGIVYASTIKGAEELHLFLKDKGISVTLYHARLSNQERVKNYNEFHAGNKKVVVATVALGMGVDIPNVQFVFHADLPATIEEYVQAIGRAGRDGSSARCLALFSLNEVFSRIATTESDHKTYDEEIKNSVHKQYQMLFLALHVDCRKKMISSYFHQERVDPCGKCDVCREQSAINVTQIARLIIESLINIDQIISFYFLIGFLHGDVEFSKLDHQDQNSHLFGCLSHLQRNEIRALSFYLIGQGFISLSNAHSTIAGGGRLLVNQRSFELLSGKHTIFISPIFSSVTGSPKTDPSLK